MRFLCVQQSAQPPTFREKRRVPARALSSDSCSSAQTRVPAWALSSDSCSRTQTRVPARALSSDSCSRPVPGALRTQEIWELEKGLGTIKNDMFWILFGARQGGDPRELDFLFLIQCQTNAKPVPNSTAKLLYEEFLYYFGFGSQQCQTDL